MASPRGSMGRVVRLRAWWLLNVRDGLAIRVQALVRRYRLRLFGWYWHDLYQEWQLRFTRWGRCRATVYPNGVWFTWDDQGIGGENARDKPLWKARLEAGRALERQGWI